MDRDLRSCRDERPPIVDKDDRFYKEPVGDGISGPALRIEGQLNEVYQKRLAEIEEKADGDPFLKEITYKEWICMLRQINKTLIDNIQDLERETTSRLTILQQRAEADRIYYKAQLERVQRDVGNLFDNYKSSGAPLDMKTERAIQETRESLSKEVLAAETSSESDVTSDSDTYRKPSSSKGTKAKSKKSKDRKRSASSTEEVETFKQKLLANVRALAFEVAEKHDEIRELKRQMLSLEDEIQKAQQKIQLKDDVIKELRNDLKSLPKLTAWKDKLIPNLWSSTSTADTFTSSEKMQAARLSSLANKAPIAKPIPTNPTPLNIPRLEIEENDTIKTLREELQQLFDIACKNDRDIEMERRTIENQQNRIFCMVEKLINISRENENKLKYYRRELLNLESPSPLSGRTMAPLSDEDSGICSDSDPDAKVVHAVRCRFGMLMDENQRLKKEEQVWKIKLEDANSRAEAKSALLEKSSTALREVADVLSNMLCKPISYDTIFDDCATHIQNPVVEAIEEMAKCMREKEKSMRELQDQVSMLFKTNKDLENLTNQLQCEMNELKQKQKVLNTQ